MTGPHVQGYGIEPDGTQTETTGWHWGVGAEGGIVSNAEDTATFLTALMRGKLLDRRQLRQMRGKDFWQGGAYSGCAERAYGWSGGGAGYKTEVWVDGDGSRVAVLLLNARHYDTDQAVADQAAHDTLASLYCGA
jgi:CubicO group peptidase (beta-lactamase class C family)